jgi:predicted dithiol-disulfide oxidoreductase (DUF899 family)
MVHEMIDGTYRQTNLPNESPEYLAKREGHQDSTISVFTRSTDGTLRHFYSGHPWLADDIKERGIDELTPIWNVLDLTPQGRGKFYASLDYGTKVQIARG